MPKVSQGDAVEVASLNWSLQETQALKSKAGVEELLVWAHLVVDLYAYIEAGHNSWVTIGRSQKGIPLVTYNITGQEPLRASGWSLAELSAAVKEML